MRFEETRLPSSFSEFSSSCWNNGKRIDANTVRPFPSRRGRRRCLPRRRFVILLSPDEKSYRDNDSQHSFLLSFSSSSSPSSSSSSFTYKYASLSLSSLSLSARCVVALSLCFLEAQTSLLNPKQQQSLRFCFSSNKHRKKKESLSLSLFSATINDDDDDDYDASNCCSVLSDTCYILLERIIRAEEGKNLFLSLLRSHDRVRLRPSVCRGTKVDSRER